MFLSSILWIFLNINSLNNTNIENRLYIKNKVYIIDKKWVNNIPQIKKALHDTHKWIY